MAELIIPIVAGFQTLLGSMTPPPGLPALRETTKAYAGVLLNPPEAYVMPVRTSFPNQGEGTARTQIHLITIRLGLVAPDPTTMMQNVMAYVKAVDDAIAASLDTSWPDYVKYRFVAEHDYGPLYGHASGQIACWPDLHCQVWTEEIE